MDSKEVKKAFGDYYLSDVYELALQLNRQDAMLARAMVLDVFQHAFHKYGKTPCPSDCRAYLFSEAYLISAHGGPNPETVELLRPYAVHQSTKAADTRPAQSSAPVHEKQAQADPKPETGTSGPEPRGAATAAAYAAAAETAQAGRENAGPRYAEKEERSSAQPVYTQVFDPEHTAYWTADTDSEESLDPQRAAPMATAEAAAPIRAESAPANGPMQTSHAYMYDKQKAKRRKLPALTAVNTILGLAFLWALIGLLIVMGYLPSWNLGYSWFNLNIYPLF